MAQPKQTKKLCEAYYIKRESQSCQFEKRSLPLRALCTAEQILQVTIYKNNNVIQSWKSTLTIPLGKAFILKRQVHLEGCALSGWCVGARSAVSDSLQPHGLITHHAPLLDKCLVNGQMELWVFNQGHWLSSWCTALLAHLQTIYWESQKVLKHLLQPNLFWGHIIWNGML